MIVKNEVEILSSPLQSLSDRKKYKLLKLTNGMKVLLVKNATTCGEENESGKENFAAVALTIDVGSFDDPKNVQGLAHFLEHMIFMGTEKYPKENEFDSFIKSRNGVDNAMTEAEFTQFYFKIGENHLSEALDRFSQFFICPLMKIESLEREMEAVESEFQNSIYNDTYRINQIFASIMARADSCVSNFTWGNLKTLKDGIDSKNLYKILHSFRKRFYRSNFMNLCIQSSLNFDILQSIVVRYFSEIESEYSTILRPISVNPLIDVFNPEFYNKIYHVKSYSKKRKLFMTYLLPSIKNYKDKSLDYLGYLITHEGRYGLNYYFKRNNLALHIVTKIGCRNFEGNSLFNFFSIEISLTREGYENIEKVLDAIFSYLLVIKLTAMEVHKEIFNEFKGIKELQFNYRKEKPILENVQEISLNMKYCNDEDIIVGKEMCDDFDEFLLKNLIDKLNERLFNLLILSDKYQKYDKIESWFETEYAEIDFPHKFNKLWNERWIRKDFELPNKNRFICKNFDIVTSEEENYFDEVPRLIFKSDFCKCFFKADKKFLLPHGFIYIHFLSPLTQASVVNLNMTSIYSMCVKNFLLEKLYPATLVGYNYKLNAVETGLFLRLSGFNEKLPILTDKITNALMNVNGVFDKLVFDTFKKELKKNCYNYLINSNQFIEDLRLHVLTSSHKFYFDRFKATEKIDFNKFKEFLHNFIKTLKIKVLIQGNFTKSHALAINDIIMKNLNLIEQQKKIVFKISRPLTYKIPCGSTYLKVKSLLANDKNSVVKNYYQIGTNSLESQCLLEILVKTIREPLFNKLRTKQQLGYSVSCSSKIDNDILGFAISIEIQEKRNSARLVDAKIEDFLWEYLSILNEMDVSDFEIVKRSIINQKRSIDIDLESEVNKNWNEIRERKYQFDRNEIEARQLELLDKHSLIIFFKEFLLSSNRRKLSLHVLANAGEDDTSLLQHGFIHLNLSDKSNFENENFKKYKSDFAAVAMCVKIGSFNDPKDIQGMSHLIEHMIFMGSEKYQKENDFDQFCASHSGYDNAFTEAEYTLYHFDIIQKHLSEALDRFANLFISPLMSLNSLEREISAIESEFQSNINDDDVRIAQIYATMIYDHHPSSNFIWGNLKTLHDNIDSAILHEKIHTFRKKFYTTDRMFLCVQSSIDISRIERSIVNQFSSIPSENGQETKIVQSEISKIFKPDFYKKLYFVKSTSEKCKVLISFVFPSIQKEHKFLEYLASLIQYEGPGSLSDYFMDESLALKVKSRVGLQNFEGNSFFTLFTIDVNLTSRGYQDFDCVLAAIFSFLLLLKSTKIAEHETRYNEFKTINEFKFRFRKEKTALENVQEIAVNMKDYEEKNVLIGNNFCPEFDGTIMKNLIDKLNENKFNVLILSDKYCKPYDMREKWFNTEYSAIDFPNEYKRLWNERWLKNEFYLPKSNEFICKSFEIFKNPTEKEEKYPRKIFENEICECYYKMDKKYELPYGYVFVYFILPLTQESVDNLNMTSIYSMCIKNFLSEKLYPATLVGYNYKLNSVETGLILRLSGFNEKVPLILDIITQQMKASISKNVFETFKKELKKNCHNCLMDLNILNDDYRHSILKPNHRSFLERYQKIDSIKYHNFKEFTKKLLDEMKIRLLIQGNFVKSRAEYIKEIILNNLRPQQVQQSRIHETAQIYQIPLGSTSIKTKSMRENDFNAVIKNYYQVMGKCDINPIADILVGMLIEPTFYSLRTKLCLGYGISCSLRKNNGIVGITISVEYQENLHSSDFIDTKIEEFLEEYQQILILMSDEDFAAARRCFISSKLTTENDLEVEVNRNFDEIRNNDCIFNRNELEAIESEKISKADILEFYRKVFITKDTKRKLSIQILGSTKEDLKNKKENQQNAIETSIKMFRECCKICSC
ncbi:hypothetical protein PVAND_004676 [Polypedilum vanderplanki]|uniref:Nardilysin-like protein n=1 Tax=Polypedilum vanderplanki TaxID=319348 RepID=A0A9J6BXU6_POLVA|nr:hypothetical protein PVAND_004676 [Polypedilum vanderplanki]